MKHTICQLGQWVLACIAAVLFFNFLLFGYERPAGWIDRSNSSTDAIWDPGSIVVNGMEGYGIHKVDSNGYLNDGFPSESGYVVCVGASHTQAKEVFRSRNYCSQLNALLGGTGSDPKVYNVGQDGYFLPDMIRNFPAIVAEFPDAGTIVLEISNVSYYPEELAAALNQSDYDENERGSILHQSLPVMQKLKIFIKEAFPVLSLTKKQILAMAPAFDDQGTGTMVDGQTTASPEESSDEVLNEALARIRSQFDGELFIVFHTTFDLQEDGSIFVPPEEDGPAFEKACEQNNIVFVNMTDRFVQEYEQSHIMPYGFHNTTMNYGHLNAQGHRMIAQELYKHMTGGDAQ